MSVLRASPFNLTTGQLISVKVVATNLKGSSPDSDANTFGAVIQSTATDAPVL